MKELVDAGATVIGGSGRGSRPAWPIIRSATTRLRSCADGPLERRQARRQGDRPKSGWPSRACRPTSRPPRWLRYIHRATGDTDIYFVANPEPHDVAPTATFRVSGKQPELWWPDSGRIEPVAVFEAKGQLTERAAVVWGRAARCSWCSANPANADAGGGLGP